jgi:DNA helicase-2/ATP-dependent DNA helicase PcrA
MAEPRVDIPVDTSAVRFRASQQAILNYKSGLMGVAAVPGAGKTFTLAHLAAKLIRQISRRKDAENYEVLIVTLTNTGVNSFKSRLGGILAQERLLLPYSGYRVRTLHGLASDILRERPALAGLPDDFIIIDEQEADKIRRNLVAGWWRANGNTFIESYVGERYQDKTRRDMDENEKLRNFAADLAGRFISLAKDREYTPEMVRDALVNGGLDLPLARFGLEIYEAYQKTLTARSGVDFPDLSRRAIGALRADKTYLKRLQKRWPFILEDEAQDSSKLQEEILRLLSDGKNWVRVGDPNQSINNTFTTSNPDFLKAFLADEKVATYKLDEAGRSARPIIDLANELVRWTVSDHPTEALQNALTYQRILPTLPNDPVPNPPADEAKIYIAYEPGKEPDTDAELTQVVGSLRRWLPAHPEETVAVLVPENERGFRFVERFRQEGIPYEELLSSTTTTRAAAEQIYTVLAFLARPIGLTKAVTIRLSTVYQKVWWPLHLGLREGTPDTWLPDVIKKLDAAEHTEGLLWPDPAAIGGDGADDSDPAEIDQTGSAIFAALGAIDPLLAEDVHAFIDRVRRWLEALILPIDQLILIVNQDLFTEPMDIAIGYKFAAALRSAGYQNPHWRLPDFVAELKAISENERRFFGLDTVETGYRPAPGRVTVATMHQAKGLEWDRVYMTGASNYTFPSAQPGDRYQDERYIIRDGLNLKAEIAQQLACLVDHRGYLEGDATAKARIDFSAERMRLFYVAITRARKELSIMWNIGRYKENRPALAMVALQQATPQAHRG